MLHVHKIYLYYLFCTVLFCAFNSQVALGNIPILCLAHLDDCALFRSCIIDFSSFPISYQYYKYTHYLLEYPYFTILVSFFSYLTILFFYFISIDGSINVPNSVSISHCLVALSLPIQGFLLLKWEVCFWKRVIIHSIITLLKYLPVDYFRACPHRTEEKICHWLLAEQSRLKLKSKITFQYRGVYLGVTALQKCLYPAWDWTDETEKL